jgi:hypothetical protein
MVKKQLESAERLKLIQEDVNWIIPSQYRDSHLRGDVNSIIRQSNPDKKKISNQTKSPKDKQMIRRHPFFGVYYLNTTIAI